MGLFEQFPYTNLHELNLDWFLNTFKDLLKEWEDQKTEFADLKEAWNALRDYVNNYFDNLDVQEEVNNKIDAMAASGELSAILQTVIGPFTTEINQRMATLEGRMDTFANLPSGSTTGDAELADIRAGINGQTYDTAGNAVRAQVQMGITSDLADLGPYAPALTVADFYQGQLSPAVDKMTFSNDLFISEESIFIVNPLYRTYLYTYSSGTWTGGGWSTYPRMLPASKRIRIVIGRASGLDTALTDEEQTQIIDSAKVYTIKAIQHNIDAMTSAGGCFRPLRYANCDFYNGQLSPNASLLTPIHPIIGSAPLKISTNWGYYRIYLQRYTGSAWTRLGWQSKEIVLDAGVKYWIVVGRTDAAALSAADIADIQKNIAITAYRPARAPMSLMSRQGEGFGHPDNSLAGVVAAVKSGFDKLRVSVAFSSQMTPYCTHEYELSNNATLQMVRYDGAAYADNININSWTDAEINRLTYKGHTTSWEPIPTLASVMDAAIKAGVKEMTWELKGGQTTEMLQTIVSMAKRYSIPVIISDDISLVQRISNIDSHMQLAAIFHYNTADAQAAKAVQCESMRFDCYYEDSISDADLTYIRSYPEASLKLGGITYPTAAAVTGYLPKYDVLELGYSGTVIQTYNET